MDQYQAPVLDDDSILDAIRTGLLGDQISHVTVEQLKVASPALFLQVCVSILQKFDVDTDHLGQNFLQPFLSSPDVYQNATFFAMHVPQYFYHLVPGCNPKVICTADLLRPKWKKMKKFLSVTINYLRFEATNMVLFEQINTKSEDLHKDLEDIENRNSKLQESIREIDENIVKNASFHQQQNTDMIEAKEELQNVLQLKQETDQKKEESKVVLEKLRETLTSLIEQNNVLVGEVEIVKKSIVTSPEKQVSEKNELARKLEMAKIDSAAVHDQIETDQWNIDAQEEIIKRIDYALKRLTKFQDFYEKLRTIKSGLMKEQFQTNDDSMSLACIKQEIDKIKQMKVDERDQIHRNKLRGQHVESTLKQRLSDVKKKSELLLSQAKDKQLQILSFRSDLEKENSCLTDANKKHEKVMREIELVKTELLKIVEQTYTNANAYIHEIVSKRRAILEEFSNS